MSLSIYLDMNRAVTLATDVLHVTCCSIIHGIWTSEVYIYGQHFVTLNVRGLPYQETIQIKLSASWFDFKIYNVDTRRTMYMKIICHRLTV